MNPFAIPLHTWRLKRVRQAFVTLDRRLKAYEAAYGLTSSSLCINSGQPQK
ncbi:hypothetical protein [Methylobacterium sp. 1973]|uniref:hypothetical protein n=1 Tax=Methylobacterium sp. 1973 TaxID=3156421 RepID=UPI0033930982